MEELIIHKSKLNKMKNFTYKCIPVPTTIATGKQGNGEHGLAVDTYQALINKAAEGGWRLSNIDTISSSQKPGCLEGLFGAKDQVVNIKMLVFEKEVE